MQIIQNKKKIQGIIKIEEGVIFADALDHYLRVRTAMSGREVCKDEPFQIIKHITHKSKETNKQRKTFLIFMSIWQYKSCNTMSF